MLSLSTGLPNILKPDAKASQIGALKEDDVQEWKAFLEEEKQKPLQYDTAEVVKQTGDRNMFSTHFDHFDNVLKEGGVYMEVTLPR